MNPVRWTRRRRRLAVIIGVLVATLGLGASPAAAHPLGNFSINHLNRLTFTPDSVVDDVIIDSAEIPTAQTRPDVDTSGDGEVSDAERAAHGQSECEVFRDAANLTVDGDAVQFRVDAASFDYQEGQAGLETSRLECRLVAQVAATSATVRFVDGYQLGRLGWHEINAVGDGSTIDAPDLSETSVTNGLTAYPVDLLESPLDVRDATIDVEFGTGPMSDASRDDATTLDPTLNESNAADSRDSLVASRPGVLGSFVDGVQERFEDLIGRRDLTVGVGLLAIGLALVLGASHALLPGHGKTVMAAYIAGRQGSMRDAVLVGFTVTATHTGGVLLLGLGLTVSTSLAGESVLGWLGVISGLLVAALGLALLVGAIRKQDTTLFGHGHTHGPGGHTHGPDGHVHDHADHAHAGHTHADEPVRELEHAHAGAVGRQAAPGAARLERLERHDHDDDNHDDHDDHVHVDRFDADHAHGDHDDHDDHVHVDRLDADHAHGDHDDHVHVDRLDADHAHGVHDDHVHVDRFDADHAHGVHDHDHDHGDHDHDHGSHDDGHGSHDDGHGSHDDGHGSHGDHDHDHGSHGDHDDGHGDHGHGHGSHDLRHGDHTHADAAPEKVSRRGLVGMGVAGGLVPSPSALIVLLSAIALGRTWFGIVLVVGYGVGMAATLTAAGILLVKIRDRYQGRMAGASGRASGLARRWGQVAPYLTAGLVLVVGLGLAIRSFTEI